MELESIRSLLKGETLVDSIYKHVHFIEVLKRTIVAQTVSRKQHILGRFLTGQVKNTQKHTNACLLSQVNRGESYLKAYESQIE